jgi:hypothetical protein
MFTQNILKNLILLKIQIPCLAPSTPHPHRDFACANPTTYAK